MQAASGRSCSQTRPQAWRWLAGLGVGRRRSVWCRAWCGDYLVAGVACARSVRPRYSESTEYPAQSTRYIKWGHARGAPLITVAQCHHGSKHLIQNTTQRLFPIFIHVTTSQTLYQHGRGTCLRGCCMSRECGRTGWVRLALDSCQNGRPAPSHQLKTSGSRCSNKGSRYGACHPSRAHQR